MSARAMGECDGCGYETSMDRLTKYPRRDDRGDKYLCVMCKGTLAGTLVECEYPIEGDPEAIRTICYVGNVLLDAIRKGGRS